MGPVSFCDILRDERERNGIELVEMSHRLHIRPDILHSIESGKFDSMPARGYTKNMIRAYARMLGLDEIKITAMYLDEVQQYEIGSSRFNTSRLSQKNIEHNRPSRDKNTQPRTQKPRSIRQDRRSTSSNTSKRTSRTTNPSFFDHFSGLVSSLLSIKTTRDANRIPRSFDTIGSTPPYARSNQGTRQSASSAINLPLILAIIVALIVIIIVIVLITDQSNQPNENVPSIPISGLTDTSNPVPSSSASAVFISSSSESLEINFNSR